MKEKNRLRRNGEILAQLDIFFGGRIRLILSDLASSGEEARLDCGWRSVQEQAVKFAQKLSEVEWGFHCAVNEEGKPASLAVHIIDDREKDPYKPQTGKFAIKLAIIAKKYKCTTGILWRLKSIDKDKLKAVIDLMDLDYKGKIGFDPFHLQPADLTLTEARDGKRLKEV